MNTCAHLAVSGLAQGVRELDVAFPLILTLSLKERELGGPRTEPEAALDMSNLGERFSLSPRERAGARGKET
ncbi:MAG: hypothetical protein HY735_35400 [Verrucomicrobia bacterium]|nr:hypothetical protein [Verrucomicrobiota bacterium]